MYVTCLDLEGVLVPEIWIAFAEASGIPALRRTTRDEPDYDKLMHYRMDILREQDDTRIALTGEHIRRAIRQLGRQWVRLLREFAVAPRITRTAGEDAGDMALIVWSGSDLSSDDIRGWRPRGASGLTC